MRSSRSLIYVLSCLLLPSWATPSVAWAQTQTQTPDASRRPLHLARRHYEQGVILYAAGDYAAARAAFETAYRLSLLPDLLFNLGRTCEKLGDRRAAADYLERFLQARPDAPDASQIRGDIARLQAGLSPRPSLVLSISRRPLHEPLALLGAGAALVILGAGLGGGALAAARDLEAADGMRAPFNQGLQDLQARGKALSSAAIAFDVIGALTCAAGAAWTAAVLITRHKDRDRPPPVARLRFSPGLAPRAGGPGLSVFFSLGGTL